MVPSKSANMNIELRSGEVFMLTRALRYYINAERKAMTDAEGNARAHPSSPKHADHARDVRRQVEPRIVAGNALMDRLMKLVNPMDPVERCQMCGLPWNRCVGHGRATVKGD